MTCKVAPTMLSPQAAEAPLPSGARGDLQARIISLKSSARRALVQGNLRDFSIPWRFIDACDANGPCKYAPDPRAQLHRFGRSLTPSEVGCFKSHIAAISEFDSNPELEWLLILEDDVWVDTNFDFSGLIDFLAQRRIDYLRLYCRRWKQSDVVTYFGERQILRFSTDPYGAQAYLLNRKASKAFRSAVRTIDMPIDDLYGRFWETGMDLFALFPFPVIERDVPSHILSERKNNPMNTKKFTFRRHLNRVIDLVAKTRRNISFRLFGGLPG
jgi:glycosyl transferase, family 25